MSHDFHCLCDDCSARRRDFWMRGEPEISLTKSQEESVKIIAAVLIVASLFAIVWALSGCGTVQRNCGAWRDPRPADGATCRECVDADGGFAECRLSSKDKR